MSGKPVNVLFTSCFATMQGGGQRSLFLLIKYLDRQAYKPHLLVPHIDELGQEASLLQDVPVFVLPFRRVRTWNIFAVGFQICRLAHIVFSRRIKIIHCDSPREVFYAFMASRFTGAKIILHARVSDSPLWLDKALYVLTDKIIAVSEAVALRFKSIDKQNKVEVIFSGVELDFYKPSQISPDTTRDLLAGYFGRIDRRKGIDILIRAVNKMHSGVKVIIIGDGDEKYVQELRVLSDPSRIIFEAYKKDIREDIAKVDVVCLPSVKGEGLPRVIIEAMACGKIVIASDCAPHRDMLGEGLEEFIFPNGDVDALALILERVAGNRKMIQEKQGFIRMKAESLYDIRSKVDLLERVYDGLLEKK